MAWGVSQLSDPHSQPPETNTLTQSAIQPAPQWQGQAAVGAVAAAAAVGGEGGVRMRVEILLGMATGESTEAGGEDTVGGAGGECEDTVGGEGADGDHGAAAVGVVVRGGREAVRPYRLL